MGSVRTMYRLLAVDGQTRERRNQLTHPAYTKLERLATGPNEVWSWDITKVEAPVAGALARQSQVPNCLGVLRDGAVRRKLAHAGHVENGFLRPGCGIAVELANLFLAGNVGCVVR